MEEQTFDHIATRREEVAQYNANISMYHTVLAQLPKDWPADIEQYRHPKKQHDNIDNVPEDKVELVAQLWYVDELSHLIRTETVERAKAAAILAALEAQ